MNIRQLFNVRISSREVCEQFLSRRRRPIVRLPQAVHVATFLPTGQGKGQSLILPFLFATGESCVVLDVKSGENAKLTANYRRRFGPVWILDPYNVAGKSDCLNPLDFIDTNSRLAIDDCNQLASALCVRTGMETEPHWQDRAEAVIAALLAVVVANGDREKGSRSMLAVREIISSPQMLTMAMQVMALSTELWDGLLTQMGGDLFNLVDKEKSSVMSTVGRHLRFLGTPAIADIVRRSSFSPGELRQRPSTLYIVLPAERAESSQGFLRSVISTVISACIKEGLDEKRRVHLILDETASLGPMPAINNVLQVGRGYGIHLQTYWQSQGQLKKCFPKEGEDLTLLSNSAQIYGAVQDPVSAEMVSKKLGTSTVVVNSGGMSRSRTHNVSEGKGRNVSYGWTNNPSNNWGQQQRPLMTADEVANSDPRIIFSFVSGVRPIVTRTIRFHEEPRLFTSSGWLVRQWRALKTLVIAMILCAAAIGVAAALIQVADAQSRRPVPEPTYYGE